VGGLQPATSRDAQSGPTINELILGYWRRCQVRTLRYYHFSTGIQESASQMTAQQGDGEAAHQVVQPAALEGRVIGEAENGSAVCRVAVPP